MCEAALSFWGPFIHPLAPASPVDNLRTPSPSCRHAAHANSRAIPYPSRQPSHTPFTVLASLGAVKGLSLLMIMSSSRL